MKKIGLLGGSFDPIHFGHINVAIEMKEKRGLDEIWWIPAFRNPLKTSFSAPAEDRLKMLQASLKGISFFHIIDHEIKTEAPSYTIETVRYLRDKYPHEFYLILGNDILDTIHLWKAKDELFSLVRPLIAKRDQKLPTLQEFKMEEVNIRNFEISSTEVRERLLEGLYVGHLVPAAALDYIYKHKLYYDEVRFRV